MRSFRQCLLCMLFALSAVHAASSRSLSAGERKDRSALLALKAAVAAGGYGNSKVGEWKQKGSVCLPKPWQHVECNEEGRVTRLKLSNLNIQAELPSKLRNLDALEELLLDSNRFSGTLPASWSYSHAFKSLKVLRLDNNELHGTLPNRKWNKKGGFRELQEMSLSNNKFHGGLPDGWHSTNRVFSNLQTLDLSNNQLGFLNDKGAVGAQAKLTEDWCLAAPANISDAESLGWCPSGVPLGGTMPNLKRLDISYNGLRGQLPRTWARMFPALQSLLLHKNDLWLEDDKDTALPAEWTAAYTPVGFPSLKDLTLYPGNQRICYLPAVADFSQDGFADINTATTYSILDDQGTEYDGGSPRTCPGPTTDTAPTNLKLFVKSGRLGLSWDSPPLDPVNGEVVFGFKVTLKKADPSSDDTEESVLQGWGSKLFRTYFSEEGSFTMLAAQFPAGTTPSITQTSTGFQVATDVAATSLTGYKAFLTVFYLDGTDSRPVQAIPGLAPGLCHSSADCSGSTPKCNATTNSVGSCVACLTNSDCSATTCGVCNTALGGVCQTSLLSCTPNTLTVAASPSNTVMTSWKLSAAMAQYVVKFRIKVYQNGTVLPAYAGGMDLAVPANSTTAGVSLFICDSNVPIKGGLAYKFDLYSLLPPGTRLSGYAASVATGQIGTVLVPLNPYTHIPVLLSVSLTATKTVLTHWQLPTNLVVNVVAFRIKLYEAGVAVPGWENFKDFVVAPSGPSGFNSLFVLDTGAAAAIGKGYFFEIYSVLMGGTLSGRAASVAAGQNGPVLRTS